LTEIGLEVPQVTALLCALKEKEMEVSTDLFTIDEAEQVILAMWAAQSGRGR